jgi:hypothetical protein
MATLGVTVFGGAARSLSRGEASPAYAAAVGLALLVLAGLGIAAWKAVRSQAIRDRMLLLAPRACRDTALPRRRTRRATRLSRGLLDSEQFAHWETGVHAEATAEETD